MYFLFLSQYQENSAMACNALHSQKVGEKRMNNKDLLESFSIDELEDRIEFGIFGCGGGDGDGGGGGGGGSGDGGCNSNPDDRFCSP